METVDMRPLKAEIEKIADPLSGFNRNNFDIKIVHTRGDHICSWCEKTIPKGSYVPCYYIGSPWAGHWVWTDSIKCLKKDLEHPGY